MTRFSCALALVLASTFVASSEGFRLKRSKMAQMAQVSSHEQEKQEALEDESNTEVEGQEEQEDEGSEEDVDEEEQDEQDSSLVEEESEVGDEEEEVDDEERDDQYGGDSSFVDEEGDTGDDAEEEIDADASSLLQEVTYKYKMISSGRCSSTGWTGIIYLDYLGVRGTKKETCRAAATALDLVDKMPMKANGRRVENQPHGCYYRKLSSPTKRLWFYTLGPYWPATSERRLLCFKKVTVATRRRRS